MSARQEVEAIQVEGQDKGGWPLLTVVGKLLPAGEGVQKCMEEIGEREWSLVYIHTGSVQGVWPLKSLYDAIPLPVKHNLKALYFIHPDLPSRLFFAAFGRFLFGAGWVFIHLPFHFSLQLPPYLCVCVCVLIN